MEMIKVIMSTWMPDNKVGEERAALAFLTIRSLVKHLKYDNLSLHIADDGSTLGTYGTDLTPLKDICPWPVTISRQERKGVGASINAGIIESRDLFIYTPDDWVLTEDLDLTNWAKLLRDDSSIGMIRFGCPHPDLTGEVKFYQGYGWGLRLDRHHYCFATRPALYHMRMIDAYGMFSENANALECENDYLDKFVTTEGPDIIYALPYTWQHIGPDGMGALSGIIPGGQQ